MRRLVGDEDDPDDGAGACSLTLLTPESTEAVPGEPTPPLTGVELLLRYSNKSTLIPHLADVLRRARESDPTDLPSVTNQPQAGQAATEQPGRLSDRLTAADVATIVAAFRQGTPKCQLAARFGVSESSIKRVLRARQVRAQWSLEERLTEQQIQALIQDYLAGVTTPQLVRRHGGSSSSIRRLLGRRRIKR